MEQSIVIEEFPVFEKGVFRAYPELFDPYFRNQPDHVRERYRRTRRTLPKYEGTIRWHVIQGPGFCGSIHPGSAKIFHAVMTGAAHPMYISDCLYINLRHRIFALSDPPGMTTLSRSLLEALDRYLEAGPSAELGELVNRVNREAGEGLRDRATLSLLYLPPDKPGVARILLAGDSYLWRGSTASGSMKLAEASPNRWGTPNMQFELRHIEFDESDFFLLASDGIIALRYVHPDMGLEEALAHHVRTDGIAFARRVADQCNSVFTEQNFSGRRAWFGGGDDITLSLIYPYGLPAIGREGTYILGGYVV